MNEETEEKEPFNFIQLHIDIIHKDLNGLHLKLSEYKVGTYQNELIQKRIKIVEKELQDYKDKYSEYFI